MTRRVILDYETDYSSTPKSTDAGIAMLREQGAEFTSETHEVGMQYYHLFQKITIIGTRRDNLEDTVRRFIEVAGVPRIVELGSDYGLVKRVLEPIDLTLRRSLWLLWLGKEVGPLRA